MCIAAESLIIGRWRQPRVNSVFGRDMLCWICNSKRTGLAFVSGNKILIDKSAVKENKSRIQHDYQVGEDEVSWCDKKPGILQKMRMRCLEAVHLKQSRSMLLMEPSPSKWALLLIELTFAMFHPSLNRIVANDMVMLGSAPGGDSVWVPIWIPSRIGTKIGSHLQDWLHSTDISWIIWVLLHI